MFNWLARLIQTKASPVAAAEITLGDIMQSLPGFASADAIGKAIYDYGTVQAAVEKIAWATGGLPWRVVDANNAEINHDLLRAPNPDMTWHEFVARFVLEYATSGDFYALLVRRNERSANSPVIAIWPLKSDLMSVQIDAKTGQITSYTYGNLISSRSFTFRPEEGRIMHIARPSIASQTNGASVMPNALKVAAIVEMLAEKLYEGLQGGTTSPAIITLRHAKTDALIGKEAIEKVKEALREHMLTSAKSGRIMVLGDVQADKIDIPREAIAAGDMDTRTELRREICFLLGVPPVLLGLKDDSTYNNYETALKAFYSETVLPMYANPLAEALTKTVFAPMGLRLVIDEDDIPVFREARYAMVETLERASFMTINEKRAMMGLPPVDGGDVVMQPINLAPINEQPPAQPEDQQKELERAAEAWPLPLREAS